MRLFMLEAGSVSEADIGLIRDRFPSRYARSKRFARREDALLCIGAGVLLHAVLGVPDESAIKLDPAGRPFIEGGQEFSISHSGGRCVLAVGKGRVGVDIELLDESNLIAARAALTDEELQWISPSPLERFHLLWTRKESVYKAAGGYSDPKQIEVLKSPPDGLFLKSVLWEGYALSVCSEEEIARIEPLDITRI